MIISHVCCYDDFQSEWYKEWSDKLKLMSVDNATPLNLIPHRKNWEWHAIAQALKERGMLKPGKMGCGFAVGTEPLSSIFANFGVQILATDQASGKNAEGWMTSGQHAASLENIYHKGLVNRHDFDSRVRFKEVDMRKLELPWKEQFDFIWSSCSIEHLGNLEAGWDFVIKAMELIKIGGIAVHTTEYNITSNDLTLAEGPSVIYRKRDVEELDRRLRRISCGLTRCDFFPGDHQYDIEYDYEPYYKNGRPHVKLLLGGHVSTSLILIIRKGCPPSVKAKLKINILKTAGERSNYLCQRNFLGKLLFNTSGKPKKLLRNLMFHNSGKPRNIFRRWILHRNGKPRKFFQMWMSSPDYQMLPGAFIN